MVNVCRIVFFMGVLANGFFSSQLLGDTTSDVVTISSESNSDVENLASGEWLGCTVDATQCRQRATNRGYSSYTAQRSDLCPNAAKFGCWGN